MVDSEKAQDALPGAAELAPRAMLPSEALGAQRGGTIARAPATGGGDASDRRRVMQQPQAPEKLQVEADSCPLLQLLAAPLAPEPWVALASRGLLCCLALDKAVADEEIMRISSRRSMRPLKPSSMMLGIGRVLPFRTRASPSSSSSSRRSGSSSSPSCRAPPRSTWGDAGPAQALGRGPRRRRAARSDAWAPRSGLE